MEIEFIYLPFCYPDKLEKQALIDNATQKETVQGEFRQPCDVNNPVVTVDASKMDRDFFSDMSYNYAVIQGGLYYFIENVVYLNNRLVEIHLKSDVLMQWGKKMLGTGPLYIARTSRQKFVNPRLHDNLRPFEYMLKSDIHDIPHVNGTKSFLHFNQQNESYEAGDTFVVVYASKSDKDFYQQNIVYPNVLAKDMKITSGDEDKEVNSPSAVSVVAMDALCMLYFSLWLAQNQSSASNVLHIFQVPFRADSSADSGAENKITTLHFTDRDFDVTMGDCRPARPTMMLMATFGVDNYGDYSADYTSYLQGLCRTEIWLPYYGYYELSNTFAKARDWISVYYRPDFANASGCYIIHNETRHEVDSVECFAGYPLPLTTTNAQAIADTWASRGIKAGIGALIGALEIGIGASTANPWLTATGIGSGVDAVATIATTPLMTHEKSSTAMTSPSQAYALSFKPYIRFTHPVSTINVGASYDNGQFGKEFGFPSLSYHPISAFSDGDFVQLGTVEGLPVAGNKTADDELRAIFLKGFHV